MAKKKKMSFKDIMRSKAGGYIVITALFAALLLFYPGNNLFTWVKAKREITKQQKLMRKYQIEIMQMEGRIDELTSDKDSLEKFAREKFHFTEPGEDVYIIK